MKKILNIMKKTLNSLLKKFGFQHKIYQIKKKIEIIPRDNLKFLFY